MTEAADLLLSNAEVHTLAEPDETHEAVAVRDGEVVRIGREYEVRFLEGVETDVIDCEGNVVLPGFVDAHTHMENLGQYLIHADLSAVSNHDEAIETLDDEARAHPDREWILGFGYDESEWSETRYLSREDLDRVSEDRPVVAMRVDMHTASLNSVALDRLLDSMPAHDVRRAGAERETGEPTGVVVEAATEAVWEAVEPDYAETRELVTAAIEHASTLGVTCVHDMVRQSRAPRVYRDLDVEGVLDCRVRLNYWSDHLDSALDAGLVTNAGSEFVKTGAIKSFTDGSFGGRTAKLFEPYADTESGESTDGIDEDATGEDRRGQWVVDPDELREVTQRAIEGGYQLSAHAIGDEAVEHAIVTFEDTPNVESARHRVEHAELATDEHVERLADVGIVASMQPNFLQWAETGGLYDQRLGEKRRKRTNRFKTMLDAGVALAFGSDCMPLDPLLGVEYAVNAPVESQRLSVTEALRAYTYGGAYAGFDEDRLGTIEVGKRADLVVLRDSPWERPGAIGDIDVRRTIVDGRTVYVAE